MKILLDPAHALGDGLSAMRAEFQLPTVFPPDVEAAARAAIARPLTDHVDRTALPFVTLDPAGSTDLDQAFAIDAAGNDLLLHYAIADVAWFVDDGDLIDLEALSRVDFMPTRMISTPKRTFPSLTSGLRSCRCWMKNFG